ncbi:FkbM family methyltransferase [Dulcicalothrix desertica]|uniref:FkbM family methyltransferase n=1 Tax=Dulcicalothrix desertica TaxID=32056 RepID=UPI001EEDA560|nr:FkbM family methyltransferase [Dulcicalothrix desertica]
MSNQDSYLQYIKQTVPGIEVGTLSRITNVIENTSWENPSSSSDWNNVAVVALAEAEQYSDEMETRTLYLEMAFDALNSAFELEQHPLCAAHLALVHSMIGETQRAIEIAFNTFINTLQLAYENANTDSEYLVYLSPKQQGLLKLDYQFTQTALYKQNSYQQALVVLSQVLCNSQLVFYNAVGRRFLQLASQVIPDSASIALQLGISSLMASEWEGMLHLHRAKQLAPYSSAAYQALYLTYRDLNQTETANYWLKLSQEFYQQNPQSPDWQWTQLQTENTFTYVPFEGLTMAVEPSLRSIVTSVLIGEGEWFEKEMEFWRHFIKPGMTVIDVGANAGVYTFSAALKVGVEGRVLAVEPFSGCVNYLKETCRVNQLTQVTVCSGAASNFNGTVKLLLHNASELNEIVSSEAAESMADAPFEEAECFTLDSLVEREKLERVDILKIDAENHELAVLEGSTNILSEMAPVILYENIAGSKGSNYQVAEYLNKLGYQLFRYQPYLQNLIPVESLEDIQGHLNLIAFPSK